VLGLWTAVNEKIWVVSNVGTGRKRALDFDQSSMTDEFQAVEWSLSHCTQQCLVRDPLLAMTVSTSHRFQATKDFRLAIASVMVMSAAERSFSSVSGEYVELFCFAALQAANGDFSRARNVSLKKYLVNLCEFLSCFRQQHRLDDRVFHNVDPSSLRQTNWDRLLTEALRTKDANLERVMKGDRMPWLVPACSESLLRRKIESQRSLLKDFCYGNRQNKLPVAGLVPGVTNSRLDVKAITWWPAEGEQDADRSLIEWQFEFKGRSGSYSLTDGMRALKEMLGGDDGREAERHGLVIGFGQSADGVLVENVNG